MRTNIADLSFMLFGKTAKKTVALAFIDRTGRHTVHWFKWVQASVSTCDFIEITRH